MRGIADSDIHNESTGETYGQYRRRQELIEIKSWIERGVCVLALIGCLILTFMAF